MITVTGFNGSGTSAITSFLIDMGISFPGPYEADINFENRLFREANDRILRPITTVPDAGPLFPMQIPDYERLVNVPHDVHKTPSINWKDPKACLTLPVWRNRVDRVVWVKRCAAHVYCSLSSYVNWSVEQFYSSLTRYDEYLSRSIRECKIPHFVISYEDLYRYQDIGKARALVEFCLNGIGVQDAALIDALGRMKKPEFY